MKGHDALALPRLIAFAELTWQPPGPDRQQPAGPEPSGSASCARGWVAVLQNAEVPFLYPSHGRCCRGTLAGASTLSVELCEKCGAEGFAVPMRTLYQAGFWVLSEETTRTETSWFLTALL